MKSRLLIAAAAAVAFLGVVLPAGYVGAKAYFRAPYLPDYTIVCYPSTIDMYGGTNEFDCDRAPEGIIEADVSTCLDYEDHANYAHPPLEDECPRR